MNHIFNRQPTLLSCIDNKAALFRACSKRNECGGSQLVFSAIPIIKYTPCGAVISYGHEWDKPRFVNLRAVKQWASATMDEAVEQLRHRKIRQIKILRSRLDDAEDALYLIEHPPT